MTSPLSFVAGLILVALCALEQASAAESWTRLNAHYAVSVSGFQVAALSLDAAIDDESYRLSGEGEVTGLASIVSSGRGATRSSGTFGGSRVLPSEFAHQEHAGKEKVQIDIAMKSGDVQDVRVQPAPSRAASRVPVLPQHIRGILDPLSAILVRVDESEPLVSPKACDRSVPVFTGWQRFDILLTYVRTREVTTPKGYSGPVVVCEARYRPVAGHRPSKESVKRAQQTPVEVWLAPVEGTRVLVPYRAAVDTVLGRGVLEARRFEVSRRARSAALD